MHPQDETPESILPENHDESPEEKQAEDLDEKVENIQKRLKISKKRAEAIIGRAIARGMDIKESNADICSRYINKSKSLFIDEKADHEDWKESHKKGGQKVTFSSLEDEDGGTSSQADEYVEGLRKRLNKLFCRAAPELQKFYNLVIYHNMTHEAAAAELGLSSSQISTQLKRLGGGVRGADKLESSISSLPLFSGQALTIAEKKVKNIKGHEHKNQTLTSEPLFEMGEVV